ncbi:MAG: ABC transporter permease, partial [Ruthenibacterium sp.]
MNTVRVFYHFLADIYGNRKLLWHLSKNDFKSHYAASFLGVIWAFIQPLTSLLVIWFVFQVALGNGAQDGYPFITWFAPAVLAWNFFSEAAINVTASVSGYSYLVRKVNFRVSILPIVKIVSASFVHLVMLLVIVLFNVIYGVGISIYNVQIIYYLCCTWFLLIGLGWLLSAISLFAPDVQSFVNIALSVGFWATPICWNPSSFS